VQTLFCGKLDEAMSLFTLTFPETHRPIVLIGAGGIVRDAHLPAYRKAGFTVTSIFDPNQERARAVAQSFGIACVPASLDDAINKAPPDAIFDIATPPSAFLDVLERLPDGRGVLIQKPMGENLAQARQIRDLCGAKKLTAAVNFQLRYAPAIRTARNLIAGGNIGQLHDMEVRLTVYTPWHLWTFLEGIPRMEILHHSVHYLDLVRSFFGDPKSVYAKTVKHPKMTKLASTRSNVILDYGDTVRANVTTNHGHEYGFRHQESYIKWEGTGGAIKARLGLLMDYPKGVPDEFDYCILEPGKPPEWKPLEVEGSWFPDAFIGTMADLMCFVEGSALELPGSVEDAYKTMAVIEAAYESNDGGGTKVAHD
jgi:predicted dehydrogenase